MLLAVVPTASANRSCDHLSCSRSRRKRCPRLDLFDKDIALSYSFSVHVLSVIKSEKYLSEPTRKCQEKCRAYDRVFYHVFGHICLWKHNWACCENGATAVRPNLHACVPHISQACLSNEPSTTYFKLSEPCQERKQQ